VSTLPAVKIRDPTSSRSTARAVVIRCGVSAALTTEVTPMRRCLLDRAG
jgi:hypothetical protein